MPDYFHRTQGIHGIHHTRRVLFLVELLAAHENLDEPERDILFIAAVYHDIGRIHDGKDLCRCYEVSGRKKSAKLTTWRSEAFENCGQFSSCPGLNTAALFTMGDCT